MTDLPADVVIKNEITAALEEQTVVLLLNNRNETVGALYPNTIAAANFDRRVLACTKTTEKFCLYVDGLAIYFSSFQKVYR